MPSYGACGRELPTVRRQKQVGNPGVATCRRMCHDADVLSTLCRAPQTAGRSQPVRARRRPPRRLLGTTLGLERERQEHTHENPRRSPANFRTTPMTDATGSMRCCPRSEVCARLLPADRLAMPGAGRPAEDDWVRWGAG